MFSWDFWDNFEFGLFFLFTAPDFLEPFVIHPIDKRQ